MQRSLFRTEQRPRRSRSGLTEAEHGCGALVLPLAAVVAEQSIAVAEPNIIAALTTEEETRISKWRAVHGTGDAASLELANIGDKQLERAVDALKGVLVFDAFVARPLAPAAKPLEKAEAKLPE